MWKPCRVVISSIANVFSVYQCYWNNSRNLRQGYSKLLKLLGSSRQLTSPKALGWLLWYWTILSVAKHSNNTNLSPFHHSSSNALLGINSVCRRFAVWMLLACRTLQSFGSYYKTICIANNFEYVCLRLNVNKGKIFFSFNLMLLKLCYIVYGLISFYYVFKCYSLLP